MVLLSSKDDVWSGPGRGEVMTSGIYAVFHLVPFSVKQKLYTTFGRSGHQRFKLVNGGWAWNMG